MIKDKIKNIKNDKNSNIIIYLIIKKSKNPGKSS